MEGIPQVFPHSQLSSLRRDTLERLIKKRAIPDASEGVVENKEAVDEEFELLLPEVQGADGPDLPTIAEGVAAVDGEPDNPPDSKCLR